MSLIVTQTAGSLGDWLSLTPLLRARPGIKVIAKDSPHTRRFATLYYGLADVEFTNESIPNTVESDEPLCFSQRILNAFGVTTTNAIPSIILTEEEIIWAKDFLAIYNSPVAFTNTVGGARADKPETDLCNYRRLPDQLSAQLVKNLRANGHTPIKFGVKKISDIYSNYDEIEGVVNIPDLTLRQVAACYSVITKYVGPDTGDHHLMLAVGGVCHTYVPASAWNYDHYKHLYFPYAWGDEPIREQYTQFNRIPKDL